MAGGILSSTSAGSPYGKALAMICRSLLVLAALMFAGFPVSAQQGARVARFTPQGIVKQVSQVQAVFSEPMVPFGSPGAAAAPFATECPEPGQGRWVDPNRWVYDFAEPLPAAVRCTFRLKPGLRTLAGAEVTGRREFTFSTGGPGIRVALPYDGSTGIAEDQVFILRLEAAVDEATVIARAGFAVSGIKDRVGVRIIVGEERDTLLKAHPWLLAGEPDHSRFLLIQCRQRFPVKARVSLVWGRGIRSVGGVATEQDQVFNFETRDRFFAEFQCERENPQAGCIPVLPMRLRFNAPLEPGQGGEAVLTGDGRVWKAPLARSEGVLTFEGPFPANSEFVLELPPGLRDDAGRPLLNADKFPLTVRTADTPALAKFPARFGIIERNADPVLPVTVRNLEPGPKTRILRLDDVGGRPAGRVVGKLITVPPGRIADLQPWLRKVAAAVREASVFQNEAGVKELILPKTEGPSALEVVGIPLPGPGLYVVELESTLLGKALIDPPRPMFVPAAALVTNLAVHFKQGRESSLAWVTTLDRGEPVNNAVVTVMNCEGRPLWRGTTDSDGLARIDAPLPEADALPACRFETGPWDHSQLGALNGLDGGLLITAQSEDDMSFVHSSWDEGIEAWRFQLPYAYGADPLIAHTVFDRTLLRAGETVHMKHLLRRHGPSGFSIPPAAQGPDTLTVRHDGTEQPYEFPLTWDDSGVAETDWDIPREAKLGTYTVELRRKGEPVEQPDGHPDGERPEEAEAVPPSRSWVSGRLRVEEFRVPLLKAVIKPPAESLVDVREVTLDLGVSYLSGGGAGLLPVTLRAQIGLKRLRPYEGFEGFVFGNGGVTEGLVRQAEVEEGAESGGAEDQGTAQRRTELVLDATGSGRAVIGDLPAGEKPREILAEMEFRDPNGEAQTVSTRIPLWNAERLVGIKPDGWAVSKDALKFKVAVVDVSGRPAADAPVAVDLYRRTVLSHRKRLVGGFYAYDHSVEIKRVARIFEGRTGADGVLPCTTKSPLAGELILVAESTDRAGRRAAANQSIWVAGKEDWWFEAADHDRIDLLPERKRYEPGETAVLQARMPFREATALITVEREGVMDAWVRRISGRRPVVEIPVKGHYAPNVFVSVLAVRGRIGEVQPTARADLGKPAFKLGVAEIDVGWQAHELDVRVTTDRSVYPVRDRAKASVRVRTAEGKAPPPGSEVAVAAVDEGLLELSANDSWDVLRAMMGRRGCEVATATGQIQVVGKRHFGLKARLPGGGGGRQITRELFDTLLLWRGRVALDGEGGAEIEVPLTDAITSFRVVAVATGGEGLFGSGAASIRTTQDLMVLPGLPPAVREGDRFRAGATVRNASPRAMTVDITARSAGTTEVSASQTMRLEPGLAREVSWDAIVPAGVEDLTWEFSAAAREGGAQDRLRLVQKVTAAVPVRVFQATLERLEGKLVLPVARPDGARPGGGIRIVARPRLNQGLSAVVDYMRGYPYGCAEQKISKAVALRDPRLWGRRMAELPAAMDSEGLVKYFPSLAQGDPVLTAYILAVGHEAGMEIPAALVDRMAAGLRKYVEGVIVRTSVLPTVDLAVRKLAAIAALARIGRADPGLLGSIALDPNRWPTSAVIDWVDILLRVEQIPARAERLAEAEQVLRARLSFQGSVLAFATETTDRLWWLMVSGDVNAARLVLTALSLEGWREDIPRLVRGALARQRNGRWDLTTANAWGVLALERFSQMFEPETVTGTTRATLEGTSAAVDWAAVPGGEALTLPWPGEKSELSLVHEGAGTPWLAVQSLAAVPLAAPVASGFAITRTVVPVDRRSPDRWSRGDTLRVRLEVSAKAQMTWVAVSDPVPAGATILGGALGRDSRILTVGETRRDAVHPAFEERSQEAFRAYYALVPMGKWNVEYTLRLNQSGTFQLPPTRVEALYAPEMFGEVPNEAIEVDP